MMCRRGASLIELIVVLFIIAVMMGLMFPAIQAARSKADTTACQNNVRQLGYAVSQYINTQKRFPAPNQWTIAVLKYVEEWPLAQAVANGIPKGAKIGRPKLFRCPAQPEVYSSVEDVYVCHYVMVVDRPVPLWNPDRIAWILHDREELSMSETFDPWYVGPEISFADQKKLFAAKAGPHPAGIFYDSNGQARGGD